MFAPQTPAGAARRQPDSWDGYRARARPRVRHDRARRRSNNFAVLTGDVHSSWAFDLPRRSVRRLRQGDRQGIARRRVRRHVGELAEQRRRRPDGEKQLADLRAARPHLHYVDGRYRGYYVVDLTRERLQADYFAVATVEERTAEGAFEKGFVTESGRNHLVEASTPASPRWLDVAPVCP